MILVLTTEAGDFSHIKIVNWLDFYNADYEILSGESILNGLSKIVINSNNELIINNRNYTNDVKVVFNRRWLTIQELPDITSDELLNKSIKNTLSSELYEIRNYLSFNLKKSIWIPNIKKLNVNKISILQQAKNNGLEIPNYIITNSKKELNIFLNTYKNIITKAIGNFPKNYTEDNFLINPIYTKKITKTLFANLPDYFFVSIFQELIYKQKEFRVLYFYGECYPVEILSQENNYSSLDSRKRSKNEDNTRLIKTTLPNSLISKLDNFMKSIDLNIGSIDVIQSINDKYYFLEVNPVGQISSYSSRTNINFEKMIVEKMIQIDDEYKNNK